MGTMASIAGLALLLLVGPRPVAAADLKTVGQEVVVGKNAVGEDCKLRLMEARSDQVRYHRYSVFCEGWSQPSGTLQHFVTFPGYPPERIMSDSPLQRGYDARLEGCGPPEATALGKGWAGVLRRCQRREGSWPVVVAVVTTGKRTYGLDTFPANLRVLEAAVVAVATHGLLPGELRCQSEPALVLTPPAGVASSPGDDGMLDASEMTQLKLDADWVVLSACNTAGPDGGLGGESLSGLTRAFLYAGARALLVSHWLVASRATTELTTGLFSVHARDTTLGRAEALRRSQLALLAQRETAHPFFWGPFVLVGDGGAPTVRP